MDEFDVVVVGTGPAGEVCAAELAGAGLAVAVVEAELVGGTCAYFACMPSKALLRPEQLRREIERVPGLPAGAAAGLDVGASLKRRDQVIGGLDDEEKASWLEERDIALYRGYARFTGARRLVVEPPGGGGALAGSGGNGSMDTAPRELAARRAVVVATGSSTAMPPIEGLDEIEPWTNREGTTASEVPDSLIVLGGGPVGCELAQAWASLGSEVTLVEAEDRLIADEERFAAEQLEAALKSIGVNVLTGAELTSVGRASEQIEAGLADGRRLRADEILVAVGRRPRVDGLDLGRLGLDSSDYLKVDGRMRVIDAMQEPNDRPWLYAIGDVNGRNLLTHAGKYQARIAAAEILAADGRAGENDLVARADPRTAPRVIFTDPQVAAVGWTEAGARERGLEPVIAETETSGTAGASFHGRNTAGTSRLIADAERGLLIGATFVGFETAELLHAATVAIVGEVPLDRLRHAIPAFPTRNEIWLHLLKQLP